MGGKPFSLAPRRPGPPRRLVIEKEVAGSPLAAKAAKRLPVDVVRDRIGPADYPDFSSGQLVLAGHRGAFVKPCPGTRGYNCCGLQIIHFGLGCYLDCSYCILQGYLDTDALVLFANLDEGLARLRDALALGRPGPHRYCTGEFTDSLLLEDLTGLGARLTRMFSAFPQALLELKTKTDHVRSLLGLDHGGRTMVSFSVQCRIHHPLGGGPAAPLERRLAAAKLLVEDGYRVGFHFDPLIRHPAGRTGTAGPWTVSSSPSRPNGSTGSAWGPSATCHA
jgi:spore photoproduct lyase